MKSTTCTSPEYSEGYDAFSFDPMLQNPYARDAAEMRTGGREAHSEDALRQAFDWLEGWIQASNDKAARCKGKAGW